VSLHASIDGLDNKISFTNMGGETVAVLEPHPHDTLADLLLELEKQLGTPQRLPGMPMRALKTLLPDGRRMGASEARRCVADVLLTRV